MADPPTLLDHLQAHLIARGIVRKPATPDPTGLLHPFYLEPREGLFAPGERKQGPEVDKLLVAGASMASEIATGSYESWYYKPCVTITYRARRARDIDTIDAQVRGELEDRRAWFTSDGLQVIESGIFRSLARIGQDERSFTSSAEYWFQLYSGRAPRG